MKAFLACSIVILVFIASAYRALQTTDDGQKWSSLFNGQDLSGWYTYLKKDGSAVAADSVFSVVKDNDGTNMIRISGEAFGILVTEKEFSDYHLQLRFRWGTHKFPPREKLPKDSGVLYHSVGPEGSWGSVWMKSLEFQVMEGGHTGNLIVVDSTSAEVPVRRREDNWYCFDRKGEVRMFDRLINKKSQVAAPANFERPEGEWNLLEIYTVGNSSIHLVNGKLVMIVKNASVILRGEEFPLAKGKIQLQSEGAEIFYKDIRIRPIKKLPNNLL